jgi:UDP-GlcNAc:undecaprenyl-phosphate/decaprenyl-phosphate GlcNAc-1-phosphate transferase
MIVSMIHAASVLSIVLPLFVIASIGLSALLTIGARRVARARGVVDVPSGGRKIHKLPTALLGGVATGGVLIVGLLCMLPFVDGDELRAVQILGFAAGIAVLMIGGIIDDVWNIPPAVQFLFPVVASLMVVGTGTGVSLVTNPVGPGAISLSWWFGDAVAVVWLLTVTYAMKFLDGLDGLAAGMAAIGATLIAVLASSDAYFQPLVALLALMVAGVHLGFLPFNRQGSIFLGEGGSVIAGFSLGVLAIISGAKVATAATALAIPLVDIARVVILRVASGRSPFKGDSSHLHFRLLHAGLAPRNAARLIWAVAALFGLIALTLQTRGKLFLLAGLVVLVSMLSFVAWSRRK